MPVDIKLEKTVKLNRLVPINIELVMVGNLVNLLTWLLNWLFTLVQPIRSQLLVDPTLVNDYNA